MKKATLVFITFVTTILIGCSGSDTYRGIWKATNEQGNRLEIVFGENDFSVTGNGKSDTYEYTQNSVNIVNSVRTYGITLGDGRSFQIHFPMAGDQSKGAILDANGKPIYIICRSHYIGYEDVYSL